MLFRLRLSFEKQVIRFLFYLHLKKAGRKNYSLKPRLFWGAQPILNFKYWNEALKGDGYDSKTLMTDYFETINKKEDFDEYTSDIKRPLFLKPFGYMWRRFPHLEKIHIILYIAKKFDIINTSYLGIIFKDSKLWKEELLFYKKCGIKLVVLPYGADYQMYSKLYSKSWQHVLLINYPKGAKQEPIISAKVEFFTQHADCIMAGFEYDQAGRWDILPYAIYPMDCTLWKPKQKYNGNNGRNGVVKVYHTPNHRGVKGTEFLIEAVDALKKEGLLVELVLLEKIKNDKVRELLYSDADILVEQLILGYALSAIEGMATGLPVITALEEEIYTRVFRRFSYLNECPMLSSSPEKIKEDLRILVTNPALREELGKAGRKFAQKYHSYDAMKAIFNAIYDKIWYNKPIDLINFFNPHNKESYNNRTEKVIHPLKENRIPAEMKQP
jgi:glycosyltransferase involved in cell wall biosynthesis